MRSSSPILIRSGLVALLIAPLPVHAQGKPSFLSVAVMANHVIFDKQEGLRSSLGFGGSLTCRFSENVSLVFRASVQPSTSEYDLVGGSGTLSIDVTRFALGAMYRFTRAESFVDASVAGTVGLIVMTTGGRVISAGALGQMYVPPSTESRSMYSIGLVTSRKVATRVSLTLSPEVFFISTISFTKQNYSLSGGLIIDVF